MKAISKIAVTLFLICVFLSSALPCGPSYVSPLFVNDKTPEVPYENFAAGRLGIIRPEMTRPVLFAAYRYIAGSGMSADEQKAMVEVWNADFNRKDFRDDTIDEVVKAWVEKRKDVVGKEEKTPDIYAERSYGGYEFFPNCTKNAFETAIETLSDRASNHGLSDPNVVNWVKAQDQVFQNCASGKQTPDEVPVGAPDWLQKDRAYQKAAAEFYSLNYAGAKKRFAEIAQDSDSPWAETADYLVARTLIRQASLSKDEKKAAPFYGEAETHLQRFVSKNGKFTASAERLMGLVKYRLHPKERVSELAKTLAFQGGNENFRQDVIDYNWLLDKFESEVLTAEEKRKQDAEANKTGINMNANSNEPQGPPNAGNANVSIGTRKNESDLEINLYSADSAKYWTFYVRADATDADTINEAEKIVGQPLTEEMKKQVSEMRQTAYANRFKENRTPDHEARYYGDEKLSRSMVPDFLRQDDLTDWLFTYQMKGAEAYLYSLKRFKESGSELWLMTALSKAEKSSTGLPRLLEAANNASRTSVAYQTIAYHTARILLEQGKTAEARKLIDDMLNAGDAMPISAKNQFLSLRLRLAETLEDFLKYGQRQAYAYDFDGESGTVEQFIAQQKTEYNPEYNKDGQEAFNREVEDRFKVEKEWQERTMFDADTIMVFNLYFPQTMLLEVEKSPALPDYLRERFLIAIWTRAFLLDDMATLLKVSPELAKYRPDLAPGLEKIGAAKTQAALDHAVLFFMLKNPILSPYIEDGMGKTDNAQGEFDSNDWWCAPYDEDANTEVPMALPPRPAFITPVQTQTAQAERKRLKEIGDAPKFLADKVMAWSKAYPADKRVPEALYIAIQSNGWTKYGCGNNTELHDEFAAYLKKHYPDSEWTAKLISDESEK